MFCLFRLHRALLIGGLAIAIAPATAWSQSAAPSSAPADPASQQTSGPLAPIQEVRAEIEQLRGRLDALEARLATLEQGTQAAPAPPSVPPAQPAVPPAPPSAPTSAQVPQGAAGAGGPQGSLPVYGNAAARSKIFNPDIAVTGNFLGNTGDNEIDQSPALDLDEAEVSLQAIVDPYARADFFLSATPEGLEVEEGFVTFSTLPAGLLLKAGKMKAQFGKVNTMHSHVLPWTDEPLAIRNLLGGEEGLSDAGVSVSKLILNPWFFLEATGELYRGDNDLFTSESRGDLGYVGRVRGYRDLSESVNLDLGTSIAYGHNDAGRDFTTRVVGLDATLRYRPLRRAIYRQFVGRTELLWSRRGQAGGDANAFGFYASGDYQFARRWFAGARYDYAERAVDPLAHDRSGSVLLTYWPSEFSQIRGQYRHTRYAEGIDANELLFQFLFSIGAHGAHVF